MHMVHAHSKKLLLPCHSSYTRLRHGLLAWRAGGSGGTSREPFVLNERETIVAIEGGAADSLEWIQFVTNSGRRSPQYGGTSGEPFRLEHSEGRPIGGLQVSTSGKRRWPSRCACSSHIAMLAVGQCVVGSVNCVACKTCPARCVLQPLGRVFCRSLVTLTLVLWVQLAECDAARAAALAAPGFVTHHRIRLRKATLWAGGLLAAYSALVLCIMAPLLVELAQGPVRLDQAVGIASDSTREFTRRYINLEPERASGMEELGHQSLSWIEAHSFRGPWLRARHFEHRWAAVDIPRELELPTLDPAFQGDNRLLVKTSFDLYDGVNVPWVGILAVLGPDSDTQGKRTINVER